MSIYSVRPGFGMPLKAPVYYAEIRAYTETLRSTKTLRQIAVLLNSAGYSTPTGKAFTKQGVSNFLRSTAVAAA